MRTRAALAVALCIILSGCLGPFSSRDEGSAELTGVLYASDLDPVTAAVRDGRITRFTGSSPGGGMHAWMRLADAVADRRVAVDVPAGVTCSSGCALVVLAAASTGRATIGQGAQVRFHVPARLPGAWDDHLAMSGGCFAVAHLAERDAGGDADLVRLLRRYRMPDDLVSRILTETNLCTFVTLKPADWLRLGVRVGAEGRL